MPDQSNQQTHGLNSPRRYVRLDALGQPRPAPELVRCVGELPTRFAWADSFAGAQYRAALHQLFDAALRRAKERRKENFCATPVMTQVHNWFLRWERILEHEAAQHDTYEP